MATIHVEKPITSEPAELLRRFEADVLSLPNFKMFVDCYEITDNTITFSGSKGITGKVEAKPGLLTVDVTLGAMASLMRPLIENRLNELLSRID